MTDVLHSITTSVPDAVTRQLDGGAIGRLYRWARLQTASRGTVTTPTPDGNVTITVPTDSHFYEKMQSGDPHEPGLAAELSDVLTPESVYYDIGSRFGIFTAYAQLAGVPSHRVHGFEAYWFAYSILTENHAGNDTQLTHCRVGTTTAGDQLAIDDYVPRHDPPTVVKIDVEGAEYDVLRGMAHTLQAHTPRLYIEVHPQLLPTFGRSDSDVLEWLADAGYHAELLDHRADEADWAAVADVDPPTEMAYLLRASTAP